VNAVRFSNRTLRITLDKNARNARFLFCLLTNCTLKLAIVTATKKTHSQGDNIPMIVSRKRQRGITWIVVVFFLI
jgi:hypothetical protein